MAITHDVPARRLADEQIVVESIGVLPRTSGDTYSRIRTVLDGEYAEVRTMVRGLLLEDGFAPVHDMPTDAHRDRILAQLRRVGQTSFTDKGFPASVGGSNDIASFVTGFEELSYGDISLQVKVGVQFGLFGGAVQHLGTDRHHQRYLPGVMDVTLAGCFAMSETGHGSDVQAIGTTASYDPSDETFVLHTPDRDSWKDYIGNAACHATHAAVFAQLHTNGEQHGVHAFVVRIRHDDGTTADGVSIEDNGHKLGLNGVDNGRLAFDGVRVARADLLDRFASVAADGTYASPIENANRRFFTMVGTLIQGRVAVSGGGVGASKLALAIAVKHGERRTQFSPADGEPETVLMDYLSHQRRILPALARTYAYHFAQRELVEQLHDVFTGAVDDDQERRRLETRAAGQKALSTWHATRTIQMAREACGGFGYLSENRLGTLKSDMDVFTTFEGDNTVLLQLVAKGLLTQFKEDFGDMDPWQTTKYVADQFVETVVEWSSARTVLQRLVDNIGRGGEQAGLLDRGWQADMFAKREEHLVASAAKRLRSLMSDHTPFAAFNHVQDHLLTAAQAHASRTVFESFVAAIDRVEQEDVKELLNAVCDLYALSVIEEQRAWFMEHGLLTVNRSKALIGTMNGLCRDLRPHANGLVDAFGIPDALLGAPIAVRRDGESYVAAKARIARPENTKD
jgi:acyl-CoA oxidase